MAKYTPEIVVVVCKNLKNGLTKKDSAILAGISEDTFYTWVHQYPEFSESVELALADYRSDLIKNVNKTARKDGKFALEVLSRRWPNDYGPNAVVEPPKPPTLDLLGDNPTPQKYREVASFLYNVARLAEMPQDTP